MMHVGREMMHVGLMRRHTASERSHSGSISRVQQTLVELWRGQATTLRGTHVVTDQLFTCE